MRAIVANVRRLVRPKILRERLSSRHRAVETVADGGGTRVDRPSPESLEQRGGRLVIPASGTRIDDEAIRSLRGVGQK